LRDSPVRVAQLKRMPRVACWGSPRPSGFLQTSGTDPTSGPRLEETTQMSKGGRTSPQTRKFVKNYPQITYLKIPWCSSPQIANPQICKEENSVSDPDPHWFASNIFFFNYVSII
jgi:hypothetical protein